MARLKTTTNRSELMRKQWRDGVRVGKPCSEDTKRKMSLIMSGKKRPDIKGVPLSEEHRKKIGLPKIGKPRSPETRLKLSRSHQGKKLSIEHIKNMTISRTGIVRKDRGKKRPWLAGENNPMWRGGVLSAHERERRSLEYKEWRTKVFVRDGWKCKMPRCKNKEHYVEAHHIKLFSDFPELRYEVDNGITLCRKCHNKTNNGREKVYEKMFKRIIKENKYGL